MKKLLLASLILLSNSSGAEDIELFVGNSVQRAGSDPKILIIFDNSGSMSTELTVKIPYNPDIDYPAVGADHSLNERFIYFTKGSGLDNATLVPDDNNETRRFSTVMNGCEVAQEKLDSVGFYTGYIREYAFQGNSGSWQEIPDNNGANIEVLDCLDDITQLKSGNAADQTSGFPIDGEGSRNNRIPYTTGTDQAAADESRANTDFGIGEVVTLYSDNYLRWSHGSEEDIGEDDFTRLEIAQNTITNLIESTPGVDFGMQVFNHNHSGENTRDGGRIIFGIQDMDFAARQELIDIVQDEVDAETNTPLCESLYEASRYFGGKSVVYGHSDSDRGGYVANTPPWDADIEDGGVYITPFNDCTSEVYVILITDGAPTRDRAADAFVMALDGVGDPFSVDGTDNYLAELAGWMHNHDLITGESPENPADLSTINNSTLFTVGFGLVNPADAEEEDYVEPDAVLLLKEAARQGGGDYYSAEDPSSLLSSLQDAIFTILEVSGSFTSPAVASNNFDRTETLDSVYYAMFLPDRGPRWQGNLKKLKVTNTGLVGRDEISAIDSSTGNIAESAKTFWSTGDADGGEILEGGVAAMLRAKTNRIIYSDLGAGSSLVPLTAGNTEWVGVNAFENDAALAEELDVLETEIDATLNWAKGIDVDDADQDESTTDNRYDIFADPLHSKPLVVNYGGAENNQDVRLIVGTNAGVLHMFDDQGDTVDETWSFMPKEFISNIKPLRDNFSSADKIYGVDGSATAYLYDHNNDNSIDSTDGDKAWIYFGLRRGGDSYYAIDISAPNSPRLMWHIDSTTAGFSELSQTWSQPKVGYSKLNVDNDGNPKPVLFFGAGYSTVKDIPGVPAADDIDTKGKGVYMVDAETGTLLWSLTSAAQSAINTTFSGIDSIPSKIALLDSDSDGLADRLYTGDTGGNVWRVDMPGDASNSATTPWTVVKLASLGSNVADDNDDDRRFFNPPTIARSVNTETIDTGEVDDEGFTIYSQYDRSYEALILGSGDRSNPAGIDTNDKFFMIKDEEVITKSLTQGDIIGINDLKDFTNNPFGQVLSDQARLALQAEVSALSGWRIDFEGDGEKSMASSAVLFGVAYFTSFTPSGENDALECSVEEGAGTLYAVDLALGTTIYDWRQITTPGINIGDGITILTVPGEDVPEGHTPNPPTISILGPDVITTVKADGSTPGTAKTIRTYQYITEP